MDNSVGLPKMYAGLDVPILPWVGNEFTSVSRRLLVLGESHYDEKLASAPLDASSISEIKNYTNEMWSAFAARQDGRFWTNIVQVVEGKPIRECNISEAVQRFAFYNYCNRIVASAARVAPSSADWINSRPDFDLVLSALQPTHILVLGQRLWNNLKEDRRSDIKITVGNRTKPVCYFMAGDRLVPSLPITHPSAAFSWLKQRRWVDALFAETYGPR